MIPYTYVVAIYTFLTWGCVGYENCHILLIPFSTRYSRDCIGCDGPALRRHTIAVTLALLMKNQPRGPRGTRRSCAMHDGRAVRLLRQAQGAAAENSLLFCAYPL